MTDDAHQGAAGVQTEPTADECVRAGMYWFGRSDFQAAEAWWQRAIELNPANTRAQECLRLLNKTSSTGFKADDANPFEAAAPAAAITPSGPVVPVPAAAGPSAGWDAVQHTGDLGLPPDPGLDRPPGMVGPSSQDIPALRRSGVVEPIVPVNHALGEAAGTDPFDFAADGQQVGEPELPFGGPGQPIKATPWDDGPSRTSVVTLQDSGGFDAVPEPTPLPNLDRERFFGRGDPESHEEIVSFLRATGDIPDEASALVRGAPAVPAPPVVPSQDLVFDDPVEMAAPEPAVPDPQTLLKEARDRFSLHDFAGVLERIEALPEDIQATEEVRNLAMEAGRNLLRMYESKIGDFERVPRVVISDDEVIWLNLNHRAGFILSQVDGMVSFEDLVALSGMPRLDTVRILADLLDKKVVG